MIFIRIGFTNCKKGFQALLRYEKSVQHKEAREKKSYDCQPSILSAISDQFKKEKDHRKFLKAIFESIQYLLVQGLALRGHIEESGAFHNLVELRSKGNDALNSWMQRSDKWISHDIQNEIMSLFGEAAKRSIVTRIRTADNFSLIADSTQHMEDKYTSDLYMTYKCNTRKIIFLFTCRLRAT